MQVTQINKRFILSIFAFLAVICLIIFLTYQRAIKQDDGWYASYVFRWLQKLGNTNIKSYWDYTDANDYDMGCSFVYTVLEGIYFSIFGISVLTMKAFNAFEAIVLCSILYIYLRRENRVLGLITVLCLVGWNMFHMHFFNRPELLASIIAVLILYLFAHHTEDKYCVFISYCLLSVLLDIHPLSLFLVIWPAVKYFIESKSRKGMAVLGWLCGLCIYFVGNYIVNHSFGIFTTAITGTKVSLGDHYIPIKDTGIKDILAITKERFSFITKTVGISGYLKLISFSVFFAMAAYLLISGKLIKNKILVNSFIGYITFILLSSFLSEATSNGFRLYHAIAFGLFYFSLLYAVYNSISIKIIAVVGLLPFLVFMKDGYLKIRGNFSYHKANKYYATFKAFNDQIPEHSKVLMRPTHALFSYDKNIRCDYTYGLLRYMHKENLSFKAALIVKRYNYITTDDLFNTEFFTDVPSEFRTSPSPYYRPLRNTGLTGEEFRGLVRTGFLTPVATLYDAFAGNTVLYQVNY